MAHPTSNGSAHTVDHGSPEATEGGATAMLVIAVRSSTGEAIAGASVCVIEPSGNQVAAARGGTGREVRVAVPLGRLLIAVTAPDHAPKAAVLEVPAAGVELNVTLYPDSELRGTVRNSGTPVANALVTLLDESAVVVAHGRSDSTGVFRLPAPAEGIYTLIGVAPERPRPCAPCAARRIRRCAISRSAPWPGCTAWSGRRPASRSPQLRCDCCRPTAARCTSNSPPPTAASSSSA